MTSSAPIDVGIVGSLRAVAGSGVVRLEGRFSVALAVLWSHLTDPGRLAEWLGEFDGDLHTDGEFRARFFATGWEGAGRVQACEPQTRILVTTRSEGEPDCAIEATLQAEGKQTILIIEDRGLPLEQLGAYGAGDQVLLEGLTAHLAGYDRGDPMARWREIHPTYQALAASLQ